MLPRIACTYMSCLKWVYFFINCIYTESSINAYLLQSQLLILPLSVYSRNFFPRSFWQLLMVSDFVIINKKNKILVLPLVITTNNYKNNYVSNNNWYLTAHSHWLNVVTSFTLPPFLTWTIYVISIFQCIF